jgi:kynurenine formamidase
MKENCFANLINPIQRLSSILNTGSMKSLLLFVVFVWAFVSCKNDPSPRTSEVQQIAQPHDSLMSGSGVVPSIKTHINASNVTMRKEASVQSDKIGAFELKEPVLILETKNVNNENEAILTKSISLYVDENSSGEVAMTLPKGKAVVIESYDAEKNKYEVSYQAPKKGKLYAQISADAVETITYSTWYKVKRASGEIGWVLGKFVNQN